MVPIGLINRTADIEGEGTQMPDRDMFEATIAAARQRGLTFCDTTPPTDRYATIDNLRLHYLDWGQAEKPAMILLHGFAVTAHTWDFFSLSARSRFHIYALEHRGHGDSGWAPDGDYRRERYAADLVVFGEALQLDSFVLIGHSLGGSVALLAASQRPERIRALVIVDSMLGPRRDPTSVRRFVEGPDTFPSLEAFADYAARLNLRRTRAGLLRSLRYNARQRPDGQWTWKYDPVLRDRNQPRPLPEFASIWSALRATTCPVLYVRAGVASHLADELVAPLEALGPRVRVATVADAAHSVMSDNPVAFERLVSTFLDEVALTRS